MVYKKGIQILCGLSVMLIVGCSDSNHSGKGSHKGITQDAHCPTLSELHLNKSGYFVASRGWKSRTNGHRYVFPEDFHPEISGWTQMKAVGFIQADAEENISSGKVEVQDCIYSMTILNNDGGLIVSMYLVPAKKHFVDTQTRAWSATGEFSYVCKQDNNPRKNKPTSCVFSS